MNLKKILILLLILIFKVKNSFAGDPYVGNGNLQLGYDTFQTFKTYVRNNIKKPEIFLVTIDGQNSYYLYCPFGECQSTKKKRELMSVKYILRKSVKFLQ
jgi:hypothetical protein